MTIEQVVKEARKNGISYGKYVVTLNEVHTNNAKEMGKKYTYIDDDIAYRLYDIGKTDRYIAGYFGCSEMAVWSWRQRNGLPSKGSRNKIDYKNVKKFYDDGLNDYEIARTLCCTHSAILEWRRKNGLQPNYKRKG